MENNRKILIASVKRLPQYLRVLKDKKFEELKYISSTVIADELKLNPVQVRKDLAFVYESSGKPGAGFEVKKLIENIEDFLGINNSKDAIVVGAGKLGQALLNYNGFGKEINLIMAFDNDDKKCDNKKIFNINKMENLIKRLNIRIAILSVPKNEAQKVSDLLVEYGIKAIWNFVPVNLNVPKDVVVKNEDLSLSLLMLLKEVEVKEMNENDY